MAVELSRAMECRLGCAVCCIDISISSPLPGLPNGKPAGLRCVNLTAQNSCQLWGTELFPKVCRNFIADRRYCGDTREQAVAILGQLERETEPARVQTSTL